VSGLAVLVILAGCVVAWSGYNDLPFWQVVKASVSKTGTIPAYTKGAGAEKAIAEVAAFELVKAAASGLSSLLPASLLAGKGAAAVPGGGGKEEEPKSEEPNSEEPAPEPEADVPPVEGIE